VQIRALWLVGALAVVTACKASVDANFHAGAQAEETDFDDPVGSSRPAAQPASGEDDGSGEQALLGARQDLALAGDSLQPSCSCLAVVAGFPSNPSFFWTSIVPAINADTQLVVAFSSEGIACPGQAPGALGASYWGYHVVNDDVVVVVERAGVGRPVTSGAIIPKPGSSGAVYVEPVDAKVPYGRPLDGQGKRCRVPTSVVAQRVVPAPPHTETLQQPPAAQP
jgi:hypothetical protein